MKFVILIAAVVALSGCATERQQWFVGTAAFTDYERPEEFGTGVNFGRSCKVGRVGIDLIPLDVQFDRDGRASYGFGFLTRTYLP